MFKKLARVPRGSFGTGLAGGILLGAGIFLGIVLTFHLHSGVLPETPLEGVASSSSETMAIATGWIGDGVEGLFVLDFITGNLTCQVLNPRTGQLAYVYHRNVAQDLGVQQGKQPKYLLITGELRVQQIIGNVRPAECMAYVADVNTGRYVAYMMPYSKQAMDFNRHVMTQMIPIGGGSARNAAIE